VAAGFLIVSVCPGAPYAPPFTAIARGDVARAVGLMVILAGSSAIFAPLLLKGLLPLVAGDAQANVNAGRIVGTLAVVQFLPLCIGLFLRARYPAIAIRLSKPFRRVGMLLNVTLIGVILLAQFRMLSAIHLTGYVGMLALLAGSILAGWLLGGPGRAGRDTLAITTSVRNVGVALVIAGGSFPGTPAVTSTTAYALFQTVVVALLVLAYGRTKSAVAQTARQVGATVEATSPVSDNA
jgi:BASS family bile acid:Na+ symporter